MAPIEWTQDGPEGDEAVTFSDHGVRIAVVGEDGSIELFDQWQLNMFGGVLPAVGDRLVTLWPGREVADTEHFRVLARYYIGEFAGDNAWWLLVAPEITEERDARMFDLAREASAETRRMRKSSSDHSYAQLAAMRKAVKPPIRKAARRLKRPLK